MPSWPVSVKGVVRSGNAVLLARNDRGEWELPGGRLEAGESPEQCVAREIAEETGLQVGVERILRAWMFEVVPGRYVFVVAYACRLVGGSLAVSGEHDAVEFVPADRLDDIVVPEGYRLAIELTQPA